MNLPIAELQCGHVHGAIDYDAPDGEHVITCTLIRGHYGPHHDLTWGRVTPDGFAPDTYDIWEWLA